MRPPSASRAVLGEACALALAGCTVGPNYQAPAPAPILPAAFAGPQWIGPPAQVDLARWWTAFDDPALQALIATAMRQAPDLQTAASRIRQARTQLVIARAAGLPSLSGAASGSYYKIRPFGRSDTQALIAQITRNGGAGAGTAGAGTTGTGTTGTGAAGGMGDVPTDLKLVSVGFDASWMVDLFGGVRRSVEAARASVESAEWDARDARIMLAAEIASDYLQMRGYQRQAAIATSEANRQQRGLEITGHTAQVGLVPQGNVARQIIQLATARAQVAPLQAQALAQIDAIAVLIGETPEALTPRLAVAAPLPPVPPVVPAGLPAELIRRRPDVRAAERQLAAATAEIGVNVAQLYPQLSLSAMPQLGAIALGGFFIGKSLQLTAQGQASFPIFDGGRRRAQVDNAREQREQAYIAWQQAVLGAVRDVEDALARHEGERRANLELADGVAAADRSVTFATEQYQAGLSNYQPVLDAQQQSLQVRNSLAQSDVRLRQDVASLYLALGGGWSEGDAAPERPVIVDAPKATRR